MIEDVMEDLNMRLGKVFVGEVIQKQKFRNYTNVKLVSFFQKRWSTTSAK